jgi:hypothetical protein
MPSRSDREGLVEEITVSLLRIVNKIAQVVAKLKSKGLVDEQPSLSDARRNVTDRGRAPTQMAKEHQSAMGRALVGTASQAEVKALPAVRQVT